MLRVRPADVSYTLRLAAEFPRGSCVQNRRAENDAERRVVQTRFIVIVSTAWGSHTVVRL